MDLRYLQYCLPDSPFYEPAPSSTTSDWPLAADPLRPGWTRRLDSDWLHLRPAVVDVPAQGWKIHVSSTLAQSEEVLGLVASYCFEGDLLFKVIRGPQVLARRNSKYGDRTASGKFIAIFPRDEARLGEVLEDLDRVLAGRPGPYILSDLRYRDGPLYVRYGGFAKMLARDPEGRLVHCIRAPDGRMVPDARRPVFRPPEWVTLPECLADSYSARRRGGLEGFPYRAVRALHFSNGGGVYEAANVQTGERVLLKEARPLAGLDEEGRDAVVRLRTEQWAMETLAGLDVVPRLRELRRGHEHWFLVRDLVDGRSFTEWLQRRNPLHGHAEALDPAEYTKRVIPVLDAVDAGLRAMHARGVVFGDVHPNNILLTERGEVRFIDFEAATRLEDGQPQRLGAPGFRAPLTYSGQAVDRYALSCLRLNAFIPATVALPWGPETLDYLLALIKRTFPVPDGFVGQVLADLGPDPYPGAARSGGVVWSVERDGASASSALVAHLNAHATPSRTDRLFPGDIHQFVVPGGGVAMATGAAGVLWALTETGHRVRAEHVDWLVDRALGATDAPPGLLDGEAGVAFVLDRLGRRAEADEALARLLTHDVDALPPTYYGGRAGIGLVLLYLGCTRGDDALVRRAVALALRGEEGGDGPLSRGQVGLLNGWSGLALLRLRAGVATGNAALLDAALEALRTDLAALGVTADSAARDDPAAPWRTPSLAGGAGALIVLEQLSAFYPCPADLISARDLLRDRLRVRFFAAPGLLTGRAGAVAALAMLGDAVSWVREVMVQQIEDFGWHAVPHDGGTAMLGEHGLRISCDLGTGAAGVLLALHIAGGASNISALPFLTFWPAE